MLDVKHDAISSSIEFIVPKTDDPDTPALTFRAMALGFCFGAFLSLANSMWAFRTNANIAATGATFAVVASYPLGLLWHKFIPKHKFWNPGKFTVKEHVLVYIITHASSVPYGMENVVSQAMPELMNNTSITLFTSLAFVFVTQFTGFGFAGLCRRFLVKPEGMLWPTTFSILAMFASFHKIDAPHPLHEQRVHVDEEVFIDHRISDDESGVGTVTRLLPIAGQCNQSTIAAETDMNSELDTDYFMTATKGGSTEDLKGETTEEELEGSYKTTRKQAFWYSVLGMYLYSLVPEYFAPALQAVSFCFPSSFEGMPSGSMGKFNTVSSTSNGVGFFSFTFDWYYIGSTYMTTPWWAILCISSGRLFLGWVMTIFLYITNTWGINYAMTKDGINPTLNSVNLFAGNPGAKSHALGDVVDPSYFYDSTRDYNLNQTAYDEVAPIHITAFFAVQYASLFLTIAAVVSHVGLWYGETIKRQFKSALQQVSDVVDSTDVHNQLMSAYWDPPDWMFLGFAVVMAGLTFLVSLWTPFKMPWWGVLLNLVLTGILIVPIGVIYAISGISISVSVLAEFIMGSIVPGDTVAVMAFKSLAINNLNQGLLLVGGLKIGHYLHVPPSAVIIAQFYGTIINVLMSTCVTWWMMFCSGMLNAKHGDWQFIVYQTFYSDGAIWGAIGPKRFFGIGSLYEGLLWCFLIGFLCPFGPWLCNRYIYKAEFWQYINFPIIFSFTGVGGFQTAVLMPCIVGFLFQVLVFKYAKEWYQNYTFVMASAFDIAIGLAIMTIAIITTAGVTVPFHTLNPNLEHVPIDY
ncbi:UNVERIFIED_CONTAM: hypothetical protein HDU68_008829 [Siphonaria sp. JEL0065]|nr:hypothetical protein HDU68_008829 [Siphonaria sp. JEL0065]